MVPAPGTAPVFPANALSAGTSDITAMGTYLPGDVLLVPVALDDRTPPKARPAVVTGTGEPGTVLVCTVSSKPPSDAPSLPLSIDDFATGGLDLFAESYVMTSRVIAIRSSEVIGKKGRLTAETLAEIAARIPAASPAGALPAKKKPGRQRR